MTSNKSCVARGMGTGGQDKRWGAGKGGQWALNITDHAFVAVSKKKKSLPGPKDMAQQS